ncbi:hypothetical protein PHYPSEUDO_006783 [Phytophthora pseudosyringae]|uniref:Dolichol phosphate-mannose biosynthesis regulatory protein n=1 Tax=Phytophthora pseudosyringae TaxID=221518 RepID=A0A8T1VHU1_9STRA|nr:hypothetical protein PHYPSEUDO_006783 [Phytophthora pseudosyringae]
MSDQFTMGGACVYRLSKTAARECQGPTENRVSIATIAPYWTMGASDKAAGLVLLAISVIVYVYYSMWVLLTPFIDAGHPIQRFFLPYHYAISIPAVLLVLLFSGAATFIGMVMIKSQKKKKSD